MMRWFGGREHVSESDLSAYVDAEGGTALADRVEAHLAACDSCREAVEDLRRVKALTLGLPRAAAPRSFALSPQAANAGPRRAPSLPVFAPALALTLLLALLFADFVVLPENQATSRDNVTASAPEKSLQRTASESGASGAPSAAADAVAPQSVPAPPVPAPAGSPQSGAPPAPAAASPAAAPGAFAAEGARSTADAGPAPPAERDSAARAEDGEDRTWLRLLEAVAAIVLVVSLIVAVRSWAGSRERNLR